MSSLPRAGLAAPGTGGAWRRRRVPFPAVLLPLVLGTVTLLSLADALPARRQAARTRTEVETSSVGPFAHPAPRG